MNASTRWIALGLGLATAFAALAIATKPAHSASQTRVNALMAPQGWLAQLIASGGAVETPQAVKPVRKIKRKFPGRRAKAAAGRPARVTASSPPAGARAGSRIEEAFAALRSAGGARPIATIAVGPATGLGHAEAACAAQVRRRIAQAHQGF